MAGYEHGVSLPPAGGDKVWMQNNMPYFEARAAEGNEEMKDLIAEIKERNLIGDNPIHDKVVSKE